MKRPYEKDVNLSKKEKEKEKRGYKLKKKLLKNLKMYQYYYHLKANILESFFL